MITSSLIAETLELHVPADFESVRAAAERIGQHLRLRGLGLAAWTPLELAVVEGLNNAVRHGCPSTGGDGFVVRVTWHDTELRVEITDPGNFTPGPDWGNLPEDPLAEHGRGGYLMLQTFARVAHHNDARGHTLELVTDLGQPAAEIQPALEAMAATDELTCELETAYETVAGLRHLASLLATASARQQIVERALARLHEIDGFAFASVRLVNRLELELDCSCGPLPSLPRAISLGDDTAETRAIFTQNTQRIGTCDELPPSDPLHGSGGPAVVAPICFENQRVGTLAIVRTRDRPFFSAGTVELVQTVAEFLGIAWATSQLQARERELEAQARELSLAAQMQARLLPISFPARNDMLFAGACRSAQTVGGDFFDAFESAGGTLLVIADAMGKGVPAAFVASVLRCAIRAREHLAADPGALLSAVNRQITGDLLALDTFVTALIGFVPAGGAELRLASAGHCPVFVRRHGGAVDEIPGADFPLGIAEATEFSTQTAALAAGDMAIFVTDGLYEIGPSPEAQLGLHGLRRLIGATGTRNGDETIEFLLAATERFTRGQPAADDRTVLVCTRPSAHS